MDFQEICEDVVTETEGALGCLAIDLDTGLILASAGPSDSAMDAVEIESALRYAIEMFRGRFIERFMRSMLPDRPSVAGFVHEAQVSTENSHLFMAAIPGRESVAIALAAKNTLTLGLAWMAVHQAQERMLEAGGVLPAAPASATEKLAPAPTAPASATERLAPAPAEPIEQPAAPRRFATEQRAPAPIDPKPIPPPQEEPAAQPIPNPLMANKHRAERLKAAASTRKSGEPRKSSEQMREADGRDCSGGAREKRTKSSRHSADSAPAPAFESPASSSAWRSAIQPSPRVDASRSVISTSSCPAAPGTRAMKLNVYSVVVCIS